MMQENDLLSQFQMIRATLHDHQKSVPFPAAIMFGWAAVSAVLVLGTSSVVEAYRERLTVVALFYIVAFGAGIALEYWFLLKANRRAGISLSPTQRYILKIHGLGTLFGVLMTLVFIQYAMMELLYLFWIFWVGLAAFVTGFLTKAFILQTGLLMMCIGMAGIAAAVMLKSTGFAMISPEAFTQASVYLSFAAITLPHAWMGLKLKKETNA